MRVLHSFYVKINKEKQKTGEKKIGKGAGRKQSCKKKLSPL
jgi:hypothetical protein